MSHSREALISGPLVLDETARQVHYAGVSVHLTRTEYEILLALMGSPGRVFTRQQLADRVWGSEWTHMGHSINVHVSNLRRKIHDRVSSAPMITTLRGVGYRFDAPVTRRSHADMAAERHHSGLVGEPVFTQDNSTSPGVITLVFDAKFNLIEASAGDTGDLVSSAKHLAGFFTPAAGFDEEKVRLLVSSLVAVGVRELAGTILVTLDDGSLVHAACRTVFASDPAGSLVGCVSYLMIPARSGTRVYPAIGSADPREDSHHASSR